MAKTQSKKRDAGISIQIQQVKRAKIDVCVVGSAPLICNRMSQKAMQELLLPRSGKSKRQGLKHDPFREFLDSPYTSKDDDYPTLLQALSAWFKAAMVGAQVDMPDVSKAAVGRNIWVTGERIPLFGKPRIFTSVVRSAGVGNTPDIRTRCIVPEWACRFTIEYARPQFTDKAVAALLATAGVVMGVGDWRPQKGSGNYGQFQIVSPSDKDFKRICKIGRSEQVEAMQDPVPHDDETETLLEWFKSELEARNLVQHTNGKDTRA